MTPDEQRDRLADELAKAHYDLVAPILSEQEYAAMADRLFSRGVRVGPDEGLRERIMALPSSASVWTGTDESPLIHRNAVLALLEGSAE